MMVCSVEMVCSVDGGDGARRTTEMSKEGEMAMVMRMVIVMISTSREGEAVVPVGLNCCTLALLMVKGTATA